MNIPSLNSHPVVRHTSRERSVLRLDISISIRDSQVPQYGGGSGVLVVLRECKPLVPDRGQQLRVEIREHHASDHEPTWGMLQRLVRRVRDSVEVWNGLEGKLCVSGGELKKGREGAMRARAVGVVQGRWEDDNTWL